MLNEEKSIICDANKALFEMGLVKWTSGNVSMRVDDYIIIKPSGVEFELLTPELMVVTDLDGQVLSGKLKPSVDLESHLYVYQNNNQVKSVLHTHSPYATSFSILGEPIPVLTTTHANVFGDKIPVSDYVKIGETGIGKEIIQSMSKNKSSTLLIRNHGVFIWGDSPEKIIKKAVVLEEIAEYTYLALLKNPNIKELDQQEIDRSTSFYYKNYGQKKEEWLYD